MKKILSIFKITGESMLPDYKEGDFVVISKIPFLIRNSLIGDIVIFNHPIYGILIKKIDSFVPGEGFFVSGTHEKSLDSNKLGRIPLDAIRGKVILHIRKPKTG